MHRPLERLLVIFFSASSLRIASGVSDFLSVLETLELPVVSFFDGSETMVCFSSCGDCDICGVDVANDFFILVIEVSNPGCSLS